MIGQLPAWGAVLAALALGWLPINITLAVREVRRNLRRNDHEL